MCWQAQWWVQDDYVEKASWERMLKSMKEDDEWLLREKQGKNEIKSKA